MRFEHTAITTPKEILANDHYVATPYDCSKLTPNAEGIIPAGTIVPANDATAIGVLLWDVTPKNNPNGTVVRHGFIKQSAIPAEPAEAAKASMPMIIFE